MRKEQPSVKYFNMETPEDSVRKINLGDNKWIYQYYKKSRNGIKSTIKINTEKIADWYISSCGEISKIYYYDNNIIFFLFWHNLMTIYSFNINNPANIRIKRFFSDAVKAYIKDNDRQEVKYREDGLFAIPSPVYHRRKAILIYNANNSSVSLGMPSQYYQQQKSMSFIDPYEEKKNDGIVKTYNRS